MKSALLLCSLLCSTAAAESQTPLPAACKDADTCKDDEVSLLQTVSEVRQPKISQHRAAEVEKAIAEDDQPEIPQHQEEKVEKAIAEVRQPDVLDTQHQAAEVENAIAEDRQPEIPQHQEADPKDEPPNMTRGDVQSMAHTLRKWVHDQPSGQDMVPELQRLSKMLNRLDTSEQGRDDLRQAYGDSEPDANDRSTRAEGAEVERQGGPPSNNPDVAASKIKMNHFEPVHSRVYTESSDEQGPWNTPSHGVPRHPEIGRRHAPYNHGSSTSEAGVADLREGGQGSQNEGVPAGTEAAFRAGEMAAQQAAQAAAARAQQLAPPAYPAAASAAIPAVQPAAATPLIIEPIIIQPQVVAPA